MRALIVVVCVSALSPRAEAKGEGGGISGFCFGQDKLLATVARFPDSAPELVVVSTNFGILVSRDGGDTYGWICPQTYGAQIAGNFTLFALPGVAVLPDGTIFVLTGAMGYWISSEDACRFDAAPDEDLRATTVVSVAARAALPDTAFAAASWPGRGPFGIFRSDDGGATFGATELVSDGTFRYGSVHVTLGGERVYATTRTQDGIIALWRSDDRGDSWTPGDAEIEAFSGVVTGALPSNVDRVYLEAVRSITGACEFDVAVLGSSDGGDTFDTVAERDEILVGSIVRDDGSVWIGWKDSGIEASEDGVDFVPLEGSPRPVGCVQPARDGDVAVCPLDDSPVLVTLWDSATGVFEPLVTLDDITGPLDCPADTPVGRECGQRWEEMAAYWGLEPGQPGEDGGAPGSDAGGPPGRDAGAPGRDAGDIVVDEPTDGCSCRVGGSGSRSWALPFLVAVALSRRSRRYEDRDSPRLCLGGSRRSRIPGVGHRPGGTGDRQQATGGHLPDGRRG
ncbi:MAG: hypothetical protein HYY06_08545 [Deltaproteobacteria bacterium]|nr:hypothetical protein [Deltaproteobacteria bacterium]